MISLVRTFCLMLSVAFLASVMLHAPVEARDQAEHAADAIAALHGVKVHDHTHPDCSETTGDPTPGHHHHHGGGDGHSFAMLDKAGLVPAVIATVIRPLWPQHALPNGLSGSGPDQPPKRMRTIV